MRHTNQICVALLVLLGACQSRVSETLDPDFVVGSTVDAPIVCEPGDLSDGVEVSPLRVLSASQYEASVRGLLSDATLTLDLNEDEGETVSALTAEKLNRAAEAVMAHPAYQSLRPASCTGDELSCLGAFLDDFALEAFRRPLSGEEVQWLNDVFAAARSELDFVGSVDVVAQVILQSPQMLYLRVDGVAEEGLPESLRRLDSYELATRLSFFLWESPPDGELLESAGLGLAGASLDAEVTRMLESTSAKQPIVQRFVDWLELEGTNLHAPLVDSLANAQKYPTDSRELRFAMRTEIEALVERALFEHNGSVEWLLTTREAYVDPDLAALYGVTHPTGSDGEFAWVELPSSERAGLFTRAGFLALYSGPKYQSAVKRGAFLAENVFCTHLGEPPPDVSDLPIDGGVQGDEQVLTTREAVTVATGSG
ncbi:MAG: DUF1592 domain-containing protein, partial [Myxococcota bacterium]